MVKDERAPRASTPLARLPAGAHPVRRPEPWTLGLLGRVDIEDLATSLRRYCEAHGDSLGLRDLRHYALHGHAFPPPTPLDELPPPEREAVEGVLLRVRPKPGDAYFSALLFALAMPGAAYCEGLYADRAMPFPRQHAWVRLGARTVDPAFFADPPLRAGPGAAYFGVEFDPALAASIMMDEGRARPVALGPPRPARQRAIEDGFEPAA